MFSDSALTSMSEETFSKVSSLGAFLETGIVRVKEAEGQWTFVATSSGQTKVTYMFYGDPRTSVPTWLMDKLIVEGSYNTMANLKKMAQKKKSCKM